MQPLITYNPNDLNINNPLELPLYRFFEIQTEKTPDETALVFGNQTMTYNQLNTNANRLAHYLIKNGVCTESIVGVCFERSIEMVIALYAIIKAGAAYVPIEPHFPHARKDFIVTDSGAIMVLTHRSCAFTSAICDKVVCIDDMEGTLLQFSPDNPSIPVAPHNAAYLIYTSGSTGKPKGVINTHLGIVNRLLWMQQTMKLTMDDAVLQKTPYSFDVSVWEFFWPLMTGARLVIAKPEGHIDPSYIANIILKEKITTIHFVPSMFRLFLDVPQITSSSGSLCRIICSGEALHVNLVKSFFLKLSCRLYNLYGPTEAAVDVSCYECTPEDTNRTSIPIGSAITNINLYVLNEKMQRVEAGSRGELFIGGIGVARGYCNRPELTKERFIVDPFSNTPEAKLYKTGDLCSMDTNGIVEYHGRIDDQVKLRGIRIELGEVETAMRQYNSIHDAAAAVKTDPQGEPLLVGYLISREKQPSIEDFKKYLQSNIPEHMVPQRFVFMETFPLTTSGKIDRKALPDPSAERPALSADYSQPVTETQKRVEAVWRNYLGYSLIGINDNLFDLGCNSLTAVRLCDALGQTFSQHVPIVKLFQFPTIRSFSSYIESGSSSDLEKNVQKRITNIRNKNRGAGDKIAIVGLAGKFPGADTLDILWENLCSGIESITHFTEEQIDPAIPEELRKNPMYIKSRGLISDADKFDAAFFGISPHEAEAMDPQHRVFLELAWAALENAGHSPAGFNGSIGVYAGVGDNYYYANNVLPNTHLVKMVGKFVASYGNEKDYIATRVSYELDCKGPGVSVNTGCSTSLLAVDLATRALLDYECDMALAGGIDIHVPQRSGQLYLEGGVFTKDGHCRPFDAATTGTMFCDGAGIVVLKRLEDALTDGNTIYAIIAGSAKNNDGSDKVSFLAPSVNGQAEVIALAQARAGVSPEDISFVEAHGTGTPVGDPIEVEGLTQAFRLYTDKKQFCGLGSIKGNIGHPTIASGIAGLLKATLSLFHEKIPGTLHYTTPNPHVDFPNSPFFVIDKLTPLPRSEKKRYAGVSSFGFGGTNVHVILEEAPSISSVPSSRKAQLLLSSAKSTDALQKNSENIKLALLSGSLPDLADCAFTLACGRTHLAHRSFAIVTDDAREDTAFASPKLFTGEKKCVAFIFPGQGAQYPGMGKSFYTTELTYKSIVDACADLINPHFERDIRDVLFPKDGDEAAAALALKDTRWTQPALFITGLACARLMQSWGVFPSAMIGHSIGELVCACLSGVLSLQDALTLVAQRGKLMQSMPQGSMLSVRLPSAECMQYTSQTVSIAAINAPSLCVLAGPTDEIDEIEKALSTRPGICKKLHTSHGFHSPMMDPVVPQFLEVVKKVKLSPPGVPFVSSVTGTWITPEQATDPMYWASHVRHTVRFSDAIHCLLQTPEIILLETGPRATSVTLAKQQISGPKKQAAIAIFDATGNPDKETDSLLNTLGILWQNGIEIDWNAFFATEKRRRIPLPTYPFDKKRYWVDAAPVGTTPGIAFLNDDHIESNEVEVPDRKISEVKLPADASTAIRNILADVSGFNITEYSDDTTFFEMGMDSLFLSQVAFKLEQEFGLSLSFGQLTDKYPSINAIVALLEKEQIIAAPIQDDTVSHASTGNNTAVPLTEAQREILMSVQIGGDEASCAFNEAVRIDLKGKLDTSLLLQAVSSTMMRHDSLRSRINANDFTFSIEDTSPVHVEELSVTSEDEIRRYFKTSVTTPFKLEAENPVRFALLQLTGEHYILAITVHHIVCDGWSIDVLLEDIARSYSERIKGSTTTAAPAPQFSEYATTMHSLVHGQAFARTREYWKNRFSDLPGALALPTDCDRPPVRSFSADRADYTIASDCVAGLREIAQKRGISFFGALLSAFEAFCFRLSGQQDVIVGVPLAGQMISGKAELVGHCVNYIPLRCRFERTMPFSQCAEQIKQGLSEASQHQPYTYGMLLDDLPFPREAGKMPLVTVSFNAISIMDSDHFSFAGLDTSYENIPRAFENFEMFINAVSLLRDNRLTLKCQFSTALFTKDMVLRRCQEFEALLRGVILNWECPVGLLPVLSTADTRVLEGPAFPSASCNVPVYSLFKRHVDQCPDDIAIISDDRTLTYRQLAAEVDIIRTRLYSLGIRKGAHIGISMQRSLHMVAALLAVVANGSAYVPLDPKFPFSRRLYMIENSNMDCLLSLTAHKQEYVDIQVPIICVDDPSSATESLQLEEAGEPDDVAYIMYTSGSTGKPKGVEIYQRSIVNFLLSMTEKPGLKKNGTICAVTTLSFDISVLELLLPLSQGARCRIVSDDSAADGFALKKILENESVTHFQATPATFRLLLEAGWQGSPSLTILCGGEAMSGELAGQLLSRCKALWNMYGPTEATVWCCIRQITDPKECTNIGRPIHNTNATIIDEQMQAVPCGVPGELCIGGIQLAKGYYQQPQKTAEQFVQIGEQRFYKTGDIGILLQSGEIQCLGRKDFQVKIRGHRIELGEIESVLAAFPGIIETAVAVYNDTQRQEKYLAAYYVLSKEKDDKSSKEIKSFLMAQLPVYMVPHYLVQLQSIPKTANGKIDRKSLPLPIAQYQPDSAQTIFRIPQPPAGETETMLVEIWRSILNRTSIDVTESFFDLGGTSFLAVKLMVALSERLGTQLPVLELFRHPSIALFAKFLDNKQVKSQEVESSRLRGQQRRQRIINRSRPQEN